MKARAWLDLVLDPGWSELFADVVGGDPLRFPGYAEQLVQARTTTGETESVVVARGMLHGAPVVAFAFEFGFLGGSMGVGAGTRIARAFTLAADEGVPVIALTASGGARMQEGMLALAQMPATLVARAALADAKQPFIAYLRNPTTGGVYASFGSSADLLLAEPGATIGFAGPRVAEAFTGAPLPPGSHTAEAALEARVIDAIVAPSSVRATLRDTLRATRVEIRLAGGSPGPADYRAYRRAITRAVNANLPIVTFIDTEGADPSASSERDGIAREISSTFSALLRAPVPTVACVTGTGGSGGALALAACDRLIMIEDATFSVIAPRGAAAILKRNDVDAVARELKIGASDLLGFGLADHVVTLGDLPRAIEEALASIAAEGAPTGRRNARWSS